VDAVPDRLVPGGNGVSVATAAELVDDAGLEPELVWLFIPHTLDCAQAIETQSLLDDHAIESVGEIGVVGVKKSTCPSRSFNQVRGRWQTSRGP